MCMNYFLFFVLLLFVSHHKVASQNQSLEESVLTKQDTLFDVEKILRVVSSDDSTWTEHCERKIPKVRTIFKAGRKYCYKATYVDKDKDTLSHSFVFLKTTGERWEDQPESQDLVYYEFPNYQTDSMRLVNHYINKKLQLWTRERGEGVVENAEWVWMHPIRVNQYKFTEVAPFPDIQRPIQKGKKWVNSINVIDGWGDWNGLTVKCRYCILGQTSFELEGSKVACWVIKSTSKCSAGKSKLITLFNEDFGFVKMEYQNYEKESLVFELIGVESY